VRVHVRVRVRVRVHVLLTLDSQICKVKVLPIFTLSS